MRERAGLGDHRPHLAGITRKCSGSRGTHATPDQTRLDKEARGEFSKPAKSRPTKGPGAAILTRLVAEGEERSALESPGHGTPRARQSGSFAPNSRRFFFYPYGKFGAAFGPAAHREAFRSELLRAGRAVVTSTRAA